YELLMTETSVKSSKELFRFSPVDIYNTKNIIFYCNQPFKNEQLNEEELNVLNWLSVNIKREIIIKIHPTSEDKQVPRLSALGYKIIDDDYPAELHIANLNSSWVISFWSTVNLNEYPGCKYFWLYPYLEKKKLMPSHFTLN